MKPTRTKKPKRGGKRYSMIDLEIQRLEKLRNTEKDSKKIQLIDELLQILKGDNSYGQEEKRRKHK